MPSFPTAVNTDPIVITPASLYSCGASLNGMGLTSSSAANPTANKAFYVPFSVHEPITIFKMFIENGVTGSGNVDVGIYDAGGVRLVSKGSTAQAGVSAIQEFDITDTTLNPGLYYLAIAMDNVTGNIRRWSPSASLARAMGVLEQTSAFPLPATATFALVSSSAIPMIGATARTVI